MTRDCIAVGRCRGRADARRWRRSSSRRASRRSVSATLRPRSRCRRRPASPIALDKLKGRVVYVDFWASWCGPCRRSFPWMNEMQQKYGARGFTVVGVNVDKRRPDARALPAADAGDLLDRLRRGRQDAGSLGGQGHAEFLPRRRDGQGRRGRERISRRAESRPRRTHPRVASNRDDFEPPVASGDFDAPRPAFVDPRCRGIAAGGCATLQPPSPGSAAISRNHRCRSTRTASRRRSRITFTRARKPRPADTASAEAGVAATDAIRRAATMRTSRPRAIAAVVRAPDFGRQLAAARERREDEAAPAPAASALFAAALALPGMLPCERAGAGRRRPRHARAQVSRLSRLAAGRRAG